MNRKPNEIPAKHKATVTIFDGLRVDGFGPANITEYPWSGNTREIQNLSDQPMWLTQDDGTGKQVPVHVENVVTL